jgi:hypothetical protein
MESRRLGAGQLRGMGVCVAALIAVLAVAVVPAQAKAVSPVLEFVSPASAFPIGFTADGGEVTAALAGYDTVVHCSDSKGEGEVIGPRAALAEYVFTGCETQGGTEGGAQCESEGANAEEIRTGAIEAELVYIDQAKNEVGMLLNPSGGIYMSFKCDAEPIKARGPFLSPVGPINKETTSFTATLSRSGATQTPNEYENAIGEKRKAIPMGERGTNPLATTGVELSFAIHPSASLEIKAVTAAEIESKQREEEAAVEKKPQDEEAAAAAAAKKRQEEEAAAAVAAKRRQEEEAAVAAAVRKREEEEAKLERLRRARLLSRGLLQCRKAQSKHKRVRCEKRVKNKYGGQRAG